MIRQLSIFALSILPVILQAGLGSAQVIQAGQDREFSHLLGSCSTLLAGSSYERIENIRHAVQAIDGTILIPKQVFSYNKTVGERTMKRGYLPAPAIVYGDLQPVVGGGICQVSSTLMNAALLSNLHLVERHRHHTPVNYLPLGLDATVNWGTKDLRFRNTLPFRIRIRGHVGEDAISIDLYGEKPIEQELQLLTDITKSPSPFEEGKSEGGVEIAVYRVHFENGQPKEREYIYRDFYPARLIEKQ